MRIECDRCKQLFDFNEATTITRGMTYAGQYTDIRICMDCLKELDEWLDNVPIKEKRLKTFCEKIKGGICKEKYV